MRNTIIKVRVLSASIFARYALCFSWLICLYLSMISPPFLPVSAGRFTIAGGCSVWYNVGKGLPWTEYSTFGSAVSARAARCIFNPSRCDSVSTAPPSLEGDCFPLLPFDNWSHMGGRGCPAPQSPLIMSGVRGQQGMKRKAIPLRVSRVFPSASD